MSHICARCGDVDAPITASSTLHPDIGFCGWCEGEACHRCGAFSSMSEAGSTLQKWCQDCSTQISDSGCNCMAGCYCQSTEVICRDCASHHLVSCSECAKEFPLIDLIELAPILLDDHKSMRCIGCWK